MCAQRFFQVLGLVVVSGGSAFATEPIDPAVELASFTLAEGFEANLFASEREGVVKPIQIRFDAAGRLWVIGSTIYPQIEPGQEPKDKVLILEDTNHDGCADKTTVFADDLRIPTGLELGDGGAYVGHGTELLFLKDRDGDGRADERRVVLRGFGTADSHQNINSFAWGPGGELWMSQGLHARARVETPWGIVGLDQAGLWRFRTRRLKLEGFYGSQHEPQNPWGFVFTQWGEPIVLAGNNSSPIYPVPGLVSARREAAPPLIWIKGQGRKVSGGDIVGTRHFPDGWQGRLLVGGYINNAVWSLTVKDDGAGFALEDAPPLLTSTSRDFRPVDVKFGPDGALYICDWYNAIIGHYQASFRHPDRDKTHGRIWRVTAKGRALTKPPMPSGATIPQLLEQLASPDRWTRHFAKRKLADFPRDEVIAPLRQWAEYRGQPELALKEALGVFQAHEIVAPELVARLAQAKEPGARAYAASVVGAWADRLPAPLALLRPLVADADPRVRLQAIVACTYVPSAEAMEVAAIAADLPTDKFLVYALNQAVFALKAHWLKALEAGELRLGDKLERLALLVNADSSRDTVQLVRALVQKPQLDAGTRERFLRVLIESGDANDLAAVLQQADETMMVQVLPALFGASMARQVRPAGDLKELLRPLVESRNLQLGAEALKLAGLWKVTDFRLLAEALAKDATARMAHRRLAIEALGLFCANESRETLAALITDQAGPIRGAAIAALASMDLNEAAAAAARWFSVSETAAPEIAETFSALLGLAKGAAALMHAFATAPPGKAAAEAGLRVLSAGGRHDDKLLDVLTEAAGLKREGKAMTPDEVAAFSAEVRRDGDPARGAEIFNRPELGCIACHAIDGQGGNIGPDLSAVGTAQPVDFIIGAIVDPQKEVKEGYLSLAVTTKEGREYQGYLVRETPEELVLRDVLQDESVRLRFDTITQKTANGSVMPPGLADTLSRAEFRDLVRYLAERGKQ